MIQKKKQIAAIMALILVLTGWCIPWSTAYAAQSADDIMPCYNNAISLTPNLHIDNSGTAVLKLDGQSLFSSTTYYISSYLEQEINGTWVRVPNGEPDSTWQDVQQGITCSVTHSLYVGRQNDCRAVISIRITGSGAEDTDTFIVYASFY